MELSLSALIARYSNSPFPMICSWPTTSSNVFGRIRDASEDSVSMTFSFIYSNKSIFFLPETDCSDTPPLHENDSCSAIRLRFCPNSNFGCSFQLLHFIILSFQKQIVRCHKTASLRLQCIDDLQRSLNRRFK